MLENVMHQFNSAANILGLNASIKSILEATNNELVVHFPIRRDNGEVEIITGYRVQHNNSLGPYKGGLRYHTSIDLDEAKALAMWMTWKTSLLELPFGGAKGGLKLNPSSYSQLELERITRRFTYALGDNIGPEFDIPAPDVNTDPQTMAWILDTFMSTKAPGERSKNLHVVTGKPEGSGGAKGRDRATGYGVFLNIKFWYAQKDQELKGKTFIVQGFGNVGYWASHFLEKAGAIMIAVQDVHGSVSNGEGISVNDLFKYSNSNNKGINGYPLAQAIESNVFFQQKCDICIPCALGNQITQKNASGLSCNLIAEGANGPIDTDGEVILSEKGIEIIPDILCNSGGVVGSYFEWLQNKNGEIWSRGKMLKKLSAKLKKAFKKVIETKEARQTDMRTAAFIIAIERLENTYKERGIYP